MGPFAVAPRDMGRAVGYNVKRLRQARRMSVAELARHSGVSKATLSLLEIGQGNPTIETVAAIAVGLRLPLGDLIQPTPLEQPIIRRGSRAQGENKQELLDRIPPGEAVEVWRLRIGPRQGRIDSPPHTAGTVERILVERGPMLIGASDDPARLEPGDLIIFSADRQHIYEACSEDAEAIVIMSYPLTVMSREAT
jgi:transcriptional regulator with XRE-family HTH domain